MSVCLNSCNLPCEQIYLQISVTPANASVGRATVWTMTATNTGSTITGPVVISNSLLGTVLLTSGSMAAGQTITITANYTIPTGSSGTLNNVAFAAQGINVGTGYTIGTRWSKVIVTPITISNLIGGPTVFVTAAVTTNPTSVTAVVTIKNTGLVAAGYFSFRGIGELFGTNYTSPADNVCNSNTNNFILSGPNASMFQIFFYMPFIRTDLSLVSGMTLEPGQTYNVTVTNLNCVVCSRSDFCALNSNCEAGYFYGTTNLSPQIAGAATITYNTTC